MREREDDSLPLLADYQVERWLLAGVSGENASSAKEPNWRQLTKFAAYHAINAWYSLPPQSRTFQALEHAFDKRWTNKVHKFASLEHYRNVRYGVLHQLYGALTEQQEASWPYMLFESSDVFVPDLGLRMSMIVQVMEPTKHSFAVHKYILEENEASIELFMHMTVVFCRTAFGALPERLRVFHMMSGEQRIVMPEERDVDKAKDYLRLIREPYLESRLCPSCAGALPRQRYVM